MKRISEFLGRAPFVLLGVLSIVAIVGNFVALEENIAQTVSAWRAVSRPIWEFLAGWFFDLLGWNFAWWVKDYWSMGVVTVAMFFRSEIVYKNVAMEAASKFEDDNIQIWVQKTYDFWHDWPSQIIMGIFAFLAWPLLWYFRMKKSIGYSLHYFEKIPKVVKHADKSRNMVFWETVIWALILLSLNYIAIGYLDAPMIPAPVTVMV